MAREIIRSERLAESTRAESIGMLVDGLVFTSGIGGVGPAAVLGQGAREAELERALDRAVLVLESLGSDLGRVAKVKVTVSDWSNFAACNRRYGQRLASAFPARACVGAQLIDPRAELNLAFIAATDQMPVTIGGPSPDAPQPRGGTRIGDLIFSNGIFAAGGKAGHDLEGQTDAILAELAASLGAADANIDHVVNIKGTTANWHGFGAYNSVYKRYFAEPYAARASVAGSWPDVHALIGVEAIASLNAERRTVESEIPGAWHDPDRERRADTIYTRLLHPPRGPHSHGVRAGGMIFAAGACPYDAADRLVAPGDVGAQTRTTLDNLRLTLRDLGADMDDIVKTNVTLSDPRHFAAFEQAYAGYFTPPYPARETVAAGLGQAGMLVEIEAIAIVGARSRSVAFVGAAL